MATKNIVPRADNEGGLGTADKKWTAVVTGRVSQSYTAGASVSGYRAIVLDATGDAVHGDKDTPADFGKVVGVSFQAVAVGENIEVVVSGFIDDPGWTWTPNGTVYMGNNGVLTQTPPTSGFICQIGFAPIATRLVVQVKPIVVLV